MAKKEIEYLSKNAYALYLGINEKAVRNAVAQGKIKKGFDTDKQKIIKHVADKEFGHLHKVVKPRAGVSKDKMAERLKSEESPKKNTQNSDKSEVKTVALNISKKSEGNIKKSELEHDNDDDFEFLLDEGLTIEELIKKLTITSEMSYAEATRRREVIQLAVDRNKLEEQQGTLLRKSEMEKVLFSFGAQIKKSLLSIPSRVADDILHLESKVEIINILTTEINEMLTAFADFENLKVNKN